MPSSRTTKYTSEIQHESFPIREDRFGGLELLQSLRKICVLAVQGRHFDRFSSIMSSGYPIDSNDRREHSDILPSFVSLVLLIQMDAPYKNILDSSG